MKKVCPKTIFSPSKFGFTLIELLIAISIATILFTLGITQYMRFNRQQILDQAVLELKTNLTNAKTMALAGKKTCSDGAFDGILVVFDGANESYTLYSSCNMDPAKRIPISSPELSQGVGIEGSPGDILFKPVTGGTDLKNNQTITLSLRGVENSSLIVTPTGKIELVP